MYEKGVGVKGQTDAAKQVRVCVCVFVYKCINVYINV